MTDERKTEADLNALREQIKRGDFGKVGRIPTVSQLAKDWRVSRTTVYHSLELLVLEGVLTARGNAYYANWPIMRVPGIMTPSFDGYLVEQGIKPLMENLIEPELIPMPLEIAQMFGQTEGVHVVHRLRKQGSTDTPYRLAEIWYPASLASEFLERMREDVNFHVINAIKQTHGLFIDRIHEEVIGRIPTAEEARQLSILRTAPVLEVHCSNFAQDGTPIMWNRLVLVASHF